MPPIRFANQRLVHNRRLVYLGAIDDKVVEYKSLSNPARQLNRLLFFSTVLGDALVLNDGYLLHSGWGREQLIDSDSPVRQLNEAEHLIFAARSAEPYSQWVKAQAKRTKSYDQLVKGLDQESFDGLDGVQPAIKSIPWPQLDFGVGLSVLLGTLTQAVEEAEVPSVTLRTVEERFGDRLARTGSTARDSWETVLKEMEEEQLLNLAQKNILMEVANEAYHVNFATGLSTVNGGAGVGVSGCGKWRFDRLGAYYQDGPQQMEELLASDDVEKYYGRILKAATVRIPKNDSDLYKGGRLAQFIRDGAGAKEQYRKALREFEESEKPIKERVEAFETALQEYAKTIDGAFGARTSTRWFTVINLFRVSGDAMGAAAAVAEASELTAHPLATHVKMVLTAGQHLSHGLAGIIGQIRHLVKHVSSRGFSLLPEWNEGFYELDVDSGFALKHSAKLPPFRAAHAAYDKIDVKTVKYGD